MSKRTPPAPPDPDAWLVAEPADYRTAAEAWRSDPRNPDGWYADPEVVLGITETYWHPGVTDAELTEWHRDAWRKARRLWLETQDPQHAGMMVAIERDRGVR